MSRRRFPYQIGYDCAGVVKEIGEDVTRFKVGDEIYTRLPETHRGNYEGLSPKGFAGRVADGHRLLE